MYHGLLDYPTKDGHLVQFHFFLLYIKDAAVIIFISIAFGFWYLFPILHGEIIGSKGMDIFRLSRYSTDKCFQRGPLPELHYASFFGSVSSGSKSQMGAFGYESPSYMSLL